MELPDQLRCLFTTTIETDDDTTVIEIPERELEHQNLQPGGTYQIAILGPSTSTGSEEPTNEGSSPDEPASDTETEYGTPDPPVEVGDTRRVEIEDIGDQGDGITRIERGFVVIVPDTEKGERVAIEITDVAETVAFAEVVERISYYE